MIEDEVPPTQLRQFTPSALLKRGQWEIKFFNNLYFQNVYFDQDKKPVADGRSAYYTGIFQIQTGIFAWLNAGISLLFKSVYTSAQPLSSPFRAFYFKRNQYHYTGLTGVGPVIKVAPFHGLDRLAIQSSLLFPLTRNLEGNGDDHPFLDYDKFHWWNQVYYDLDIHPLLNMFFEVDFLWRTAGSSTRPDLYQFPASVFLNVYPLDRWTLYHLFQFAPTITPEGLTSYYLQWGIGTKIQLTRYLEMELSYTDFPAGKNAGAGQTINLGVRLLRY